MGAGEEISVIPGNKQSSREAVLQRAQAVLIESTSCEVEGSGSVDRNHPPKTSPFSARDGCATLVHASL